MSRGRLIVVLAFGATILAAGARAATSLAPPPNTPDPKQMVLVARDLGGATVSAQQYFKDSDFPSVISYEREFSRGKVGKTVLLNVQSQAEVGTSAVSTQGFVATLRRLIGTKKFRAMLKKDFENGAGDTSGLSHTQVGAPRALGVAGGFDVPITARVLSLRIEAHLTIFRVDRVLGLLITVGVPGGHVPRPVLARLAGLMAARMNAALLPRNLIPPTITGVTQVGQTLTAAPGTWSGDPVSFSYRWQRCDATGAGCADIPGAAGPSYLVTDADAGSTVRVAVKAQNGAGAASAFSATSAVVAAAAPTNTALPAVTGPSQVGQTLTASTGEWTGAPTSFAFQWQRCDAAGANCIAIAGASAATYVPTAADTGSTIRVAVTASNAVGSTTALSVQTSPVAP
jgi:hypothetical protein